MKKRFICLLLSFAFVFSCFILTACDDTVKNYTISVNTWYSNYGYASGGGNYSEGKNITIIATEKNDSTFIAWSKNEQIVSYEKKFSFVVSNETAGKYTAIFTCPSLELSNPICISYTQEYNTDTTINSEILTLSIGSSYENCKQIFTGEIMSATGVENIEMENPIILDTRKPIYLKATLEYKYDGIDNNQTVEFISTKETLTTFNITNNKSSKITLLTPVTLDGNCELEITFETLKLPEVEENN